MQNQIIVIAILSCLVIGLYINYRITITTYSHVTNSLLEKLCSLRDNWKNLMPFERDIERDAILKSIHRNLKRLSKTKKNYIAKGGSTIKLTQNELLLCVLETLHIILSNEDIPYWEGINIIQLYNRCNELIRCYEPTRNVLLDIPVSAEDKDKAEQARKKAT